MQNNIAIKVSNLTKIYHLYDKPQDRLKEALHPFRKSYHHDFYAIKDVSFEIKKGETVGIIGKNGAGKSTLLKMITGVLTPTSGNIEVNGKIASLLELGAGFNPEMTGLENIYLNGTLMGFTQEEMDSKVDSILEFADIGEFIYQQVKTYSSGMFARLAFSVSINVEPDILIIDEVLSVGDIRFQQKCFRKISDITSHTTIIFVSHDMESIKKICSKAYWISDGKIHQEGSPHDISKNYFSKMIFGLRSSELKKTVIKNNTYSNNIPFYDVSHFESFGDKNAEIVAIALYDKNGESLQSIKAKDKIFISVKTKIKNSLSKAGIGIAMNNSKGILVYAVSSYHDDYDFGTLDANNVYIISMEMEMPMFKNGDYTMSIAVSNGDMFVHTQEHWLHDCIAFKIENNDIYRYNMGILAHHNIQYNKKEIK